MKRIIPLILALFFVVGCSKDSGDDKDNSEDVVVNEPKPIDDNTTPSINTPINDATPSIDGNSLNANIVANYDSMVIDGKTYEIKNVDTNSVSVVTVPYSIQATYNTSTSKVCLLQDNGTKVKLGFEAGDVLKIYQITQTSMLSVGDLMVAEEDLSEDQTTGTFRGDLTLSYDEDAVFEGNIYLLAWKPYIEGWPHGFTSLDDAIRKSVYLKSEMFIYNPEATSTIRMFPISIAILEILTHQSPIDFTIEYNGTDYPYNNVRITNGKLYLSIATDTYFSSSALGLNRQLIKDPKIYRVNRLDDLTGVFSVGSGITDKVHFSRGNLQATTTDNGTTWTWGFATNQYDYIGNSAANTTINGNGTVSTNGTVDLFGWVGSTSSWTGEGAIHGISNATYNSLYGYKMSDNLKSDWGKVFGKNSPWFTLSVDQWTYLFNTRTTTSNIRYAKATICGNAGVILLPDDWSTSTYSLSSTNTADAAFTANTITTAEQWKTLEDAGAVFLPAAGDRYDTRVDDVGGYGNYWSSSPYGTNYACCVRFKSDNLNPTTSLYRCNGFSVRLVRFLQ